MSDGLCAALAAGRIDPAGWTPEALAALARVCAGAGAGAVPAGTPDGALLLLLAVAGLLTLALVAAAVAGRTSPRAGRERDTTGSGAMDERRRAAVLWLGWALLSLAVAGVARGAQV